MKTMVIRRRGRGRDDNTEEEVKVERREAVMEQGGRGWQWQTRFTQHSTGRVDREGHVRKGHDRGRQGWRSHGQGQGMQAGDVDTKGKTGS